VRGLHWTNEAVAALASLTDRQRRIALERVDLVRQFPAMYPVRQRGRFSGLRYFVLQRRWIVYYRLEDERLTIIALVPALARPR